MAEVAFLKDWRALVTENERWVHPAEGEVLQVDEEFADLIAPLTESEYANLEASIVEEGCRDPLMLWNGIIIDGHHRYAICTTHLISFRVIEKTFQATPAQRGEMMTPLDETQLRRMIREHARTQDGYDSRLYDLWDEWNDAYFGGLWVWWSWDSIDGGEILRLADPGLVDTEELAIRRRLLRESFGQKRPPKWQDALQVEAALLEDLEALRARLRADRPDVSDPRVVYELGERALDVWTLRCDAWARFAAFVMASSIGKVASPATEPVD